MFPVLTALMLLLFRKQWVRIIATILIGGFTVIGGFSIGFFYLPAGIVMLLASCVPESAEPGGRSSVEFWAELGQAPSDAAAATGRFSWAPLPSVMVSVMTQLWRACRPAGRKGSSDAHGERSSTARRKSSSRSILMPMASQ